jgi:formylglycine-generating enzyme required for sulfatase activity
LSRLIEIYGEEGVRRFDETNLPLVIGADDDAHIRLLDGPAVAAYVGESRNHLFLQPAANDTGRAVYHNDEPVTGSVWLKSGDTIRIGDCLIRWHLSGRRLEVHVSPVSKQVLRPPVEPPGDPVEKSDETTVLLATPDEPVSGGHRTRNVVIGLFLLLLVCAAFVLLARPLAVTVSPAPDSLAVSGFPPVVPFGDRYLGLPGGYTLHAEKAGYRSLSEELEISGRENDYVFTLEKLPGLFHVTSHPAGTTLLIDGTVVGQTPLDDLEVPAGQRTLRFEHPRYLPHEESVDVKGFGERQSLQVELEPAWTTVEVLSEPSGALLTVDGEAQGETPLTQELLFGERQLLLSKETFTPLEITLEVAADRELTLPVYKLEPAPAIVAITSSPNGATVSADSRFMGQTPLTVKLQPDSDHVIRLTAAGYLPASRKLSFTPGESRELDITLKPQYGTIFITATPPQAKLLIDGKRQEQTNGRFRLTTRAHTLELSADGYQKVTRKVTPQPGYSQRIEIDLPHRQGAKQSPVAAQAAGRRTALGQSMILVKPGPFVMGASRKEPGRRANEGEHEVNLQRAYYISEREVTNRDYLKFQAQHSSGMVGNRSLEIDTHPVVNVSWDDAARFMNWLSKQDGLSPFYREEQGRMVSGEDQGPGYRLPSEAEWAYAARLADRKERVRYPWTGRYPPKQVVGNFADESARHLLPVVVVGYDDGFPATAPVGSFAADPAGFYDMGGNVAEWCHDYYAANPGSGQPDPLGPATGTHRVVRGSSWRDASITELRFSYRRYSREPANDIGFRIARYVR